MIGLGPTRTTYEAKGRLGIELGAGVGKEILRYCRNIDFCLHTMAVLNKEYRPAA